MIIRIKDLRLRTIIGVADWERKERQDVVINAEIEFDGSRAAQTDKIEDTVNYRDITKRIVAEVEASDYQLLERLVDRVLGLVLEDERVRRATVEIDKPQALRFADSVSISASAERGS